MMAFKRHLPNLLTLCNLLSGTIGIIEVFEGSIFYGACFIWAGAVFDFLDGFSARALDSYSDIGKELDSLADMVTFGVLPSIIIYRYLSGIFPEGSFWPYVSLLPVIFSALRLAKFNVDANQKEVFIGLPTPANAFLLSGLPFIPQLNQISFFSHPWFIIPTLAIASFLMVSPVRFISLKFKNLKFRENLHQFVVVMAGILLISVFRIAGISLTIIAYIIISVIKNPGKKSINTVVEG
jgi:CDP-diacylglycerol--serine O-phosphatidyltransferase